MTIARALRRDHPPGEPAHRLRRGQAPALDRDPPPGLPARLEVASGAMRRHPTYGCPDRMAGTRARRSPRSWAINERHRWSALLDGTPDGFDAASIEGLPSPGA